LNKVSYANEKRKLKWGNIYKYIVTLVVDDLSLLVRLLLRLEQAV